MSRRYLFGPVSAQFARENLSGPRQLGECLAFNATGDADMLVSSQDTWDALRTRLPADWRPDFILLDLPYHTIPACLWSAPLPLVALAEDWDLLWHGYRHVLDDCDLVLTDLAGAETMSKAGFAHARPANLLGCRRALFEKPLPETPRDIDILFVGNLNPAVQWERLPWLARVARLSERRRVVVYTGVYGDNYEALLRRARIVFNRSRRGNCNRRAFETAAAGALLFQERDNREIPGYFRDRQECVYYTGDDLESLLEYYLEHEAERQRLAEAARIRGREFCFETQWQEQLAAIEEYWLALDERVRRRRGQANQPKPAVARLLGRTWQLLASPSESDPSLADDLATAAGEPLAQSSSQTASLLNALGLTVVSAGKDQGRTTSASAARAAEYFCRALGYDPNHVLAGLNLVEALAGTEQSAEAVAQARQTLAALEQQTEFDAAVLDGAHFPAAWDVFRVEWELAAWRNADNPAGEAQAKRDLLRWRLHTLLADLTGGLSHRIAAVRLRPDLPATQADLGLALMNQGRHADAIEHLATVLAGNPFDGEAAQALFVALGAVGDTQGQRRVVRDRRLLTRAVPQLVPEEAWFAGSPDEALQASSPAALVSIIILCCNELEYTRLCLESVLRNTQPPYELILVDNGSTDDTPNYLAELPSRPGPARVEVIRNAINRGFPAGCNQGLAQARGEYMVFLNNDTVVTPGWLDGLIAWTLRDGQNVGLVGAVSNYAAPPQQVPADYADLADLDDFAARRQRDFAGKAMFVERLTGFCLLVRRPVLDQVGGFDELYGLGFFDDDDLCVRAREAGFRLALALDVFIHHFGSRTFASLRVDCQQQLQENFARFQAKWGPERAAGYLEAPPARLGEPAATGNLVATTAVQSREYQGRISLTMIVKNERDNLPACLGSAADLVHEMIVVDTGSTDGTQEIARQFGARVIEFPWIDNFAAARNEALRHATGDWVFWLDADDRLDPENREYLRTLFASLRDENVGYVMKCHCLPDHDTGTATVVDHVRLFRNHPHLRWRYRVHEQILPTLRQLGGDVRWSEVVIHHTGYQDAATRRRKLDRDLRLLQLEDAEHPNDPFTLFNLGCITNELGQTAEALRYLRRSLERSDPGDSIVRKLYALITGCHRQLGQFQEATAACRTGLAVCPDDPELLFLQANLQRELGDLRGAEAALLRLFEVPPSAYFASVDPTLRGYKGRHLLAGIYRAQGRLAEAEAQWREAVEDRPGFLPAWLELGELYLNASRWDDLEWVANQLETEEAWRVDAASLRAKGHLARKEFDPARRLLEATIGHYPLALLPQVLLSYVHLQEGRDWEAAEKALRAVLALDPANEEARHNLAVLMDRVN